MASELPRQTKSAPAVSEARGGQSEEWSTQVNELAQVSSGALAPSDYATFEVAKQNDGIIGGTDIAQIRSYAAYARAQAQAIHKTIAATSGIEDVAAIKQEALETEQTFARVSIYADQRIGELLRELPKAKAGRKPNDSTAIEELPSKGQALQDAGITAPTAYQLEQLAANPDVVEAVIAKAEEEGRIVSRAAVLKAIKERDDALAEVEALERQNDQLYEQASRQQEPQVIEREVYPDDYQRIKADSRRQAEDYQKLRKRNEELREELAQAKVLLGEKDRADNATWDIEVLTTATNNYLRQYGGKAWAFDQFYRVDEVTQAEFVKAITNLAVFSQNLLQMINDNASEA